MNTRSADISNMTYYQSVRHLTEKLLNNYSRNLPPIIQPYIVLILSFDEAEGILSIFGFFSLKWYDMYIRWNITENNDIDFLLIPIENVWVPN